VSVHNPVRPSWSCTGCGADWPCPTRRAELAAEYDRRPASLVLYLSGCLVEACSDLPLCLAGALHARFLGWLRPGF